MERRRRRWPGNGTLLSPLSISLAYCLLSIAWILFSDRFAGLIPDRTVAQQVQSVKGIGFVLGTTVLMYGVISWYRRLLIRAADERVQERERRDRIDRLLDTLHPADTPEGTMRMIVEAVSQLPEVHVAAYLLADEDRAIAMSVAPRLPGSWQLARSIASALDAARDVVAARRVAVVTAADGTSLAAVLEKGACRGAALAPVTHEGETIGVIVAGARHPFTAAIHEQGLAEIARTAGAWLGPVAAATREREQRRRSLMAQASRLGAVFQPIVDLTDGRPVGYEALTRFEDGTPPAARFAEAVELGIGPDLEELAIRRALADAAVLPRDRWLAINVSASLLLDGGRLAGALLDLDRPIVVELTEQEAIVDYGAIRRAVDELGANVRLAIDDIGEAFSGLRHLVELGPSLAKLDLALVREIDADPARQALVAALHHYMLQTGAHLVAEGVESVAEREMLVSLGIRYAQGFLFGRPAPIHQLVARERARAAVRRLPPPRRPVSPTEHPAGAWVDRSR